MTPPNPPSGSNTALFFRVRNFSTRGYYFVGKVLPAEFVQYRTHDSQPPALSGIRGLRGPCQPREKSGVVGPILRIFPLGTPRKSGECCLN